VVLHQLRPPETFIKSITVDNMAQLSPTHVLASYLIVSPVDYPSGYYQILLDREPLQVGDLVLLHNTVLQHSHSSKLNDKWRRPYRIREVSNHSTFYRLGQLDGVLIALAIAGNRLERFYSRMKLDSQRQEIRDTIWVRYPEDLGDE